MTPGNTTAATMAGSGSSPSGPKLKDSCDMCSSSKVKCNKEKPTCSRCRKLGYPCFYSPARRIGRPHPSRRTNPRKTTESRLRLSGRSTVDDSMPPTPENLPPVSDSSPQRPFLAQGGGGSEPGYVQNPQHWLDELNVSPSAGIDDIEMSSGTALGQVHDFNASFENKYLPCYLQSPLLEQFPKTPDALHVSPHWANYLPPHFDNTIFPLEMGLGQSSSQASSAEASSNASLSCDQTPLSDLPGPDCVTGALEILRQLQNCRSRDMKEPRGGSEAPGLAEPMQIASSAVNRLSTILVCPCSRKTYVGILVAAVCLSILDAYDSLFAQSKGEDLQSPFADKFLAMNSIPPFPMDLDDGMGEGLGTMGFDAMTRSDTHVSHVKLLEELSKLANVVMQFSRRYKADPTSGTLSALADSLKVRLRTVTNEAFKRGSY